MSGELIGEVLVELPGPVRPPVDSISGIVPDCPDEASETDAGTSE
jgi:hypothetical protein